VRPRDHVDRNELAHSARSRGTGVRCRLHCRDIPTDDRGDQGTPDLLVADQGDLCSLHHGISGLDHSDQAPSLDHSESFTIFRHLCCPPVSALLSLA
jgi:hypothetical protein